MSTNETLNEFRQIGTEIVKEGVFERFPELVPVFGGNYSSDKHKKLLLVGESNYFPDEWEDSKSVFKNAELWYKGENCSLIPEEMQRNVSNWVGDYKLYINLFNSMKFVLDKCEITGYKDYLLEEASYYNYFLRPARGIKGKNGFQKDCKPIDSEVSYIALCSIIKEKNPDILIFASKYAWTNFDSYCKKHNQEFTTTKIEWVNHPSVHFSWHHRYGNGKQKFEKLLLENWIK
ncbi:MAG: hypothetical protein LBN93_00515 [Candidatus Symbiothrix sp.]|jgi:hypothetical protein|nr:hypothetical protein [Candidatus Symbiothrix sp.]